VRRERRPMIDSPPTKMDSVKERSKREAHVAVEGWYSDPFGIHEHRWFSDGIPTALVRDQGTTSQDRPPDTPSVDEPHLIESPPSLAEDDLRRGEDEAATSGDPVDAAWTYFTRGSGGF